MKAYWQQENNFGDKLTPYLFEKIHGERPEFSRGHGKVVAVGSVMHHAKQGDIIWGTGMISERHFPKTSTLDIRAVRGPLTRDRLQRIGIECPEVYGDPALLLPAVYRPDVTRKHQVGFVRHYVDGRIFPDLNTIDVTLPVEQFIDRVLECDRIVSSSLHGLVVADAYGIPSQHFPCKGLVGGNFKFADYELGKVKFNAEKLTEVMP